MKFTITGRVLPENAAVWFDPVEKTNPDGLRFVAHCRVSQLHIVLEHPKVLDCEIAKITAENLVQCQISAIGFALGGGYFAEIIQVVGEDQIPHFYGPKNEPLAFKDSQGVLVASSSLAWRDVHFRFALIDYGRAMVNHFECGWYCYRAVESIMQAFGSWPTMHKELGTNEPDITKVIKNKADPIRHGKWSSLPATTNAERQEALEMTRDILDKYLKVKG